MPKITKDELLEKQIREYDRACKGVDTYKNYKKFDYWTLDDGLKLLIAPTEIGRKSKSIYPSLFDVEFLENSGKYKAVTRAINRSLPVEGNYEEKRLEYKNSDTEKTVFNYWYYCCAYLKVNPFEFLEFVKQKEIFKIPSDLEYIKTTSKSGKVKYDWATGGDIRKQIDNESLDPRAETTYLNIIGALLDCVTGEFKDEEFSSETKLRKFIDENYKGNPGLSSRTLAEKFASAKKSLKES